YLRSKELRMHRQSSRPAPRTFLGLAAAAIALATACNPSNNVKPGAPVLTEIAVIENGATATAIIPGYGQCQAGLATGNDCDSSISVCAAPEGTWCRCDM